MKIFDFLTKFERKCYNCAYSSIVYLYMYFKLFTKPKTKVRFACVFDAAKVLLKHLNFIARASKEIYISSIKNSKIVLNIIYLGKNIQFYAKLRETGR